MNYYNEFNLESAAMIRQFMADGLIPHGDVDTRSITEVTPNDLKSYTQCHFFAGIAGWTFALQLAGWPPTRPVWTGSAPCQPFSSAGRQEGKADERHLLPVWIDLIRQCRPASVYGEQVSSAVAHGWLDDVYQGLEAEGYACGAAVLPACSVGAPHKRDRLWFVAHATGTRPLPRPHRVVHSVEKSAGSWDGQPERRSDVGYTPELRIQGSRPKNYEERRENAERHLNVSNGAFWAGARWEGCADGKSRLVEPSIPLLAHGFQHRRPLLHALGNAIVPQVAAEFIKASM